MLFQSDLFDWSEKMMQEYQNLKNPCKLYVWIHYIPFGNTWQFQDCKECILILMKEMLIAVSSDNWFNCWQLLHHHLITFIARQWDFLFIILYLNIVYPAITMFPFVSTMTLLIIVLLKKTHWTALDVNVNCHQNFLRNSGESILAKFTNFEV